MMRLALACVLVVLAAPLVAADTSLGRLFFTPAQRASLDVARSQRTRVTVATERTEEVAQPVPQTVTYGGMVRRSDGRTTVWLNDRTVEDKKSSGGPAIVRQVRPDGAVTLEVRQSSRRVDLKVGQSVEVLSGSIEDGLRRQSPAGAETATTKGSAADRKAEDTPSNDEDEGRGSSVNRRATAQEALPATAGSR